MAPLRPFLQQVAGALLALGCWLVSAAHASPEVEDARSAAPASCVAEQYALRSYVIALQSGDVTSGARDPERIAKAITPLCQQAIQNGRWPGLTRELLARAPGDPVLKRVICQIAPPEALSAIAPWEADEGEARATYDVPCAVALFRHRPEDFTRVVAPRLAAGGGCAFPFLAVMLGEALRPDERIKLLPTLEFATRTHAEGRDRLYEVLCEHPAARTQAVCQAPAILERTWAHEARIGRALPWIALHVGLAVLFAVAACLLRYRREKDWPAPGMTALVTAATAGAVAWIVASAPTPGAGALNVMNLVLGVVVTPVAALLGALLGWAVIRTNRHVALAWCLLHATVYAVMTALHVWKNAWDRLC